MRIFIILLLSLITFSNSDAQSFELKNNIEIIIKMDGQQCLVHTVESKQTLYNISRLYNFPLKSLMNYNKLTTADIIYQGNKIYIPLNHKIYSKKFESVSKYTIQKPIVYTVRPKDTFYAISKRYFNIEKNNLLNNNNLKSDKLSVGQSLIVGWIELKTNYSEWDRIIQEKKANKENAKTVKVETPTNKVVKEERIINTIPLKPFEEFNSNAEEISIDKNATAVKDKTIETNEETTILEPTKKSITESGVAIWNKMASDKINSFVLHPTAKINSVIELYNPLTKRTAYAKVIAHIPDNTYESDVAILLSPRVAERLGALDERFKIQMTYYR